MIGWMRRLDGKTGWEERQKERKKDFFNINFCACCKLCVINIIKMYLMYFSNCKKCNNNVFTV